MVSPEKREGRTLLFRQCIGRLKQMDSQTLIKFKNLLISDDLSMKSLKGSLKENTIRTFNSGCNLALHCNGNLKEMEIVGKNSPYLDKFLQKKTSQFYKFLS